LEPFFQHKGIVSCQQRFAATLTIEYLLKALQTVFEEGKSNQ